MTDEQFWQEVDTLPALTEGARAAAIRSTLGFFTTVRSDIDESDIDWNRFLIAASLVSVEAPERLQDRALRVVQGCLQDPRASARQKDAAEYLLARLGNGRAAQLARDKHLVVTDGPNPLGPLGLDLVRRDLALSVPVGERRVPVNEFQRRFWNAAMENRWLSVSAPTSAGKSHIVRMWLEALVDSHPSLSAVYVVPTRALIEEVSRELEDALGSRVTVTTMPWDSRVGELEHEIFVLTQERLHILIRQKPDIQFDLIFVDESQKLGDGERGVLLQRTLDEASSMGTPQVVLASPLTSNPELLVAGRLDDSAAFASETVTVNQSLIHVTQRARHPRLWEMAILVDGDAVNIGEFDLPARPVPESKRLSLVAVALGRSHSGNVVYANGAAEAEKIAGQIFDALDDAVAQVSVEVREVIDLVQKTVHPQYLLGEYLKRGVAFHYGNMPLLVREAVERLFRDGRVSYLVCTSTLLEGVNLPCQNLFVRGPRKGNNNPMAASDFWNLAGRAGRWGVEFQGNVVCLDTDRAVWAEVPIRRTRQPITRATDAVSTAFDALIEYIGSETPVDSTRATPILQSLFGILASTRRQGASIASRTWMPGSDEQAEVLDTVVDEALAQITVPSELLQTHADISPFAIQRLHDLFVLTGRRDLFDLPLPEADGALDAYKRAIALCDRMFGADFGDNEARHFSLALLFIQWMRGLPLSVLISGRLRWMRENARPIRLPRDIRYVLRDVEQYARFEGPRYLSCFVDVLNHALPAREGSAQPIDIAMMMELGVSRTTEVSMMSLGLSRTSVVALSEFIVDDELSPEAALEWLRARDLESVDVPALVIAEVRSVMARANAR